MEPQAAENQNKQPNRSRWLALLLALVFVFLFLPSRSVQLANRKNSKSSVDAIDQGRKAAFEADTATRQLQNAMELADAQLKRAVMTPVTPNGGQRATSSHDIAMPTGLSPETSTTNNAPAKTIKPPVITVTTNQSGKEVTSISFPEVVTASGQKVAANANFVGVYGENLVFRDENQKPFSLPVDQLHPYLLQLIGVDSTVVKRGAAQKRNQQDADAQKAFQKALDDQNAATSRLLIQTRQMQQLSYDQSTQRDTTSEKDLQAKMDKVQRLRDQAAAIVVPPQRYYYIFPSESYPAATGAGQGGSQSQQQSRPPPSAPVRPPLISGRLPYVNGRMAEPGYGITISGPVSQFGINGLLRPNPFQ